MVIGSLGGMRNMLLSALRAIPGCHVTAHILAARMQKAVILGARKYFSPCNLLTLYEGQIRPSLEYCSRIWGAGALTTLSILDAVQKRAIRLIGHPALTRIITVGSLGGMRNMLLSALRAIPGCHVTAHILAARMQKAVILGSLRLLGAHDTRNQ
nr:unnamed protein product [Callosobruchus chinensis]